MNTQDRQAASSTGASLSTAANIRVNKISEAASDAYGAVKGKVEDTVERGMAAASDARAMASDAVDASSRQIKTFASELEAMTKRNPLGTLAGALIAGMVIGLMIRPRT